jgi:hypothetical protein
MTGPARHGTRLLAKPGGASKARGIGGHQRPTWMDDPGLALPCQPTTTNPVDPDWWFAPEGWWLDRTATTQADVERAVALCGTCPMRLACRDHGLRFERHGVWGAVRVEGLNAAARRDLLASLTRRRRTV